MYIGLIADLHANLPALMAVLAELDRMRVDLVLCAGDLLGYGADPDATLHLLRERGIPSVSGNYDYALAWDLPRASHTSSSLATEPVKQAALDWTRAHLADGHRPYLRGLPWMFTLRPDGLPIAVLHAGYDDLDVSIDPQTPAALFELESRLPAEVIVLGHTHHAYVFHGRRSLFVNPGAVGRSLDGDPRAAFAIVDTATREVTLRRMPYDVDEAVHRIEASGMPAVIGKLIRHGARRVEEVMTL